MRIVIALLLLTSISAAQLEGDPRYVKKRAERMMARLNYEAAIDYLQGACKRIEKDGEIRLLLGECFFARSRWVEAAKAFKDGVWLDQDLAGRVSHYPLALIRCNKLDEAEEQSKILVAKGSNGRLKANGNFGQGLIAWHRGEIDAAIKFFKAALGHDSRLPKAHYRLGLAYLKKKKLELGIASLQRTLDLDGLHHAAAHNLALAYGRAKNRDAAKLWRERHRTILKSTSEISQIKRSLQLEPDQIPLVRRLADLYYKHKLFEDAAMPYSACVADAPATAEPRYLYASCLFETGNYHGARLQLAQVVERFPDHKRAKKIYETILKIAEADGKAKE
ncbi:MAG: tetratricopeptide (TPR) repeat protein [Planctomycetota bacterium]|jgi:tetratricopeptide (TPR) repeat protein